MFVALVGALGSFIVLGVPAIDPAKLSPVSTASPLGILVGAGVLGLTPRRFTITFE